MFGHSQEPENFQAKRRELSSRVDFSDLRICPWLPPAAGNISWQFHHRLPLLFLINTEYSLSTNQSPKDILGLCIVSLRDSPVLEGLQDSLGCVVWCPVEVPQPQGSSTGLSWALGCKIHGGALQGSTRMWKGLSQGTGDDFAE